MGGVAYALCGLGLRIGHLFSRTTSLSALFKSLSCGMGLCYCTDAKKTAAKELFPSQGAWQEGAGSLLLLAAVQQTEALTQLETALTSKVLTAAPSLRLA